jgi:hypothetical protein
LGTLLQGLEFLCPFIPLRRNLLAYLYTKELRQKGYLVRANSEVELTFDLAGENVGHLVRANETVRLQFDTDNEWQAYIVRANEDVAIQYDLEGEWIGLVI